MLDKLDGGKETFYILEYTDTPGCYTCDDQFLITESLKGATRYPKDQAERLAKKSKGKLTAKKLTVLYVVEDL